MYPSMKSRTIKLGEFSVRIAWEYDNDSSPTQWLGGTKNKIGPYCIDRRLGYLLGEYKHGYLDIPIPEGLVEWELGYDPEDEEWNIVDDAARAAVWKHLGVIGLFDGSDTDEEVEWYMPEYEDDNTVRVYYGGYEILRDDLRTPHERHEYRYFYPGIKRLPSLEDADIESTIRDWNRFEDFYRGDWGFLSCVVEVYFNGLSVGGDSKTSIATDMNEGYFPEVERDLLQLALDSAHEHCVDLAEAARASYELDETRIEQLLAEMVTQSEAETD